MILYFISWDDPSSEIIISKSLKDWANNDVNNVSIYSSRLYIGIIIEKKGYNLFIDEI